MNDLATTRRGTSRREFLKSLAVAGGALAWQRYAKAETAFDLFQSHPALMPLDPTDAEPAIARLVQSWLTPIEQFYVRSHGKVPALDPGEYRLRVNGLVDKELTLSLADLSGLYSQASVMATMQCAGNRRAEFSAMKKVGGTQWGPGAIGNANWTGVPLAAVLKAAGVKDGAKHVQFTGRDTVPQGTASGNFGASVPLEKGLAPETLLAYAMNGDSLTPEHGFPLRAVVPGFFGVRSVKWLDTITVSADESPNFYQQKAYKVMPPSVDEKTVDWTSAKPINDMIVNSAIGTLDVDKSGAAPVARVRGYAVSAGAADATLAKVELSPDGGKTWQEAAFVSPEQPFCWRLWEGTVPLNGDVKTIAVRATTKSGTTQSPAIDWNFKGYCYNAYHSRSL